MVTYQMILHIYLRYNPNEDSMEHRYVLRPVLFVRGTPSLRSVLRPNLLVVEANDVCFLSPQNKHKILTH